MEGVRSASLVHATPGRIRIRFERALRSPEFMQSLADSIAKTDGVRQVSVNPSTGSLLLTYDPEILGMSDLYLLAKAAGITLTMSGTANPAASDTVPPAAAGISSAFDRLNGAVADFTGGKADARTLIPMGLAAWALRQITLSKGNLTAVPWYVLLWYSFEIFTRHGLKRRGQ